MTRALALTIGLILVSGNAWASCGAVLIGCNPPPGYHVGAPAPLIGMGLPSAVAIGGAFLGFSIFRRKKK